MEKPQKILLAPLDWGLGHATRCIPVVTALLDAGHEVWLAADGPQACLLKEHFPEIPLLPLKGYGIRYSRLPAWISIIKQIPGVIAAIRREHRWLQDAVSRHHFTWVVSDNRYGLWHPGIRSTMITHQLHLMMPGPWKAVSRLADGLLRRLLRQFNEIWIPDTADNRQSLSGAMGHPEHTGDITVRYVGWLSRFSGHPATKRNAPPYRAVFLLSGPEPQRSLLEKLLIRQAAVLEGKFLLVRGLPEGAPLPELPDHMTAYNHLPAEVLREQLLAAGVLVSRSGYSTVMDAAALRLKCLFIPTPGQWEQEYLAQRLGASGMAVSYSQSQLNLEKGLAAAEAMPLGWRVRHDSRLLEDAVHS